MTKISNKNKIEKFVKENKKLTVLIVVVLFLFLSFSVYRIWLNAYFLVTDDLILLLEPQDKSLSILYGEKPNITVVVDIDNSFVCNTFCSYEFKDISTGDVVDKGTFTSKGIGKKFSKDFQLSVDRAGSGQKLYSFEIKCNNIRTFYCPTDENERKRSSFITLNYDISEFEKSLKKTLKENITNVIDNLSGIDVDVQNLNNKFFELGFNVNLNEVEDEKEILNNDYNTIVLELANIARVWSEQNYLLLAELFNRSYDIRISDVNQRIIDINSKTDEIVERHNVLVDEFNDVDNELREINETILFLNRADVEILNKHKELLDKVNNIKNQINENSFLSYNFLENEVDNIKKSFDIFENEAKNAFRDGFIKGSYFESLEKEKLCDIKGICINKTDFLKVLINSINIDDKKIGEVCSAFETIKEVHKQENNKSNELLKNYKLEEINEILENAKQNKISNAKNNIFNEIKDIKADGETNSSLNLLLDISAAIFVDGEIDYGNFSEEEILSLINISLSKDSENYSKNYCDIEAMNVSEYYGNKAEINKVNEVEESNFVSRINIELTENFPLCCVFGECKRCCTDNQCEQDPSLNPILFLHGHALNRDNSPEYSLDAFNKIQTKLQEEGYISAGAITPVSDFRDIQKGDWGLSSKPISVKGSYYLVSYYNLGSYTIATQKSENIETYAIRLKELIELLKFRTGKEKVTIISHSMGGLVARSYMQIFGDEDIDKLIMIATPNNGISGSINSYCPILGEKNECKDMSENSIFIKKLNDPNKIPQNAEIFNIVGTGCENGDGIVSKENAKLEYAENFFVNGTCDGFSDVLHTQILDIDRYPEVYDTIQTILKNN